MTIGRENVRDERCRQFRLRSFDQGSNRIAGNDIEICRYDDRLQCRGGDRIRDVDNANIEDLTNAVIKTVREGLKPGGAFILKSFFTDTLKGVTQELQKTFQKVTPYKPAASRSVSSEVYLICTGKK